MNENNIIMQLNFMGLTRLFFSCTNDLGLGFENLIQKLFRHSNDIQISRVICITQICNWENVL